jgi:hypothetical protein
MTPEGAQWLRVQIISAGILTQRVEGIGRARTRLIGGASCVDCGESSIYRPARIIMGVDNQRKTVSIFTAATSSLQYSLFFGIILVLQLPSEYSSERDFSKPK